MRAGSWAGGVLATLALSTIAVGGVLVYRSYTQPPVVYAAQELARLDGQGTIRLADLRGHPLVVNFFASWCPACIAEMPAIDRVYRSANGKLYVVGVDEQDTPSEGLALARRLGVTYPLALDSGNRLYRQLQGVGMPITAFFRADGSLARVYAGQLDEQLLLQLISGLAGAHPTPE